MVIVIEVMTNLKVIEVKTKLKAVRKKIEASSAKTNANATMKIWNAGKCVKIAWLITLEVTKKKITLDVMMNRKEARRRMKDVMTNPKEAGRRTKAVVAATAKIIAIAAAETGSAKKSAINAWKSSSGVMMNLKEDGMMNPKEAGKMKKAVVAAGAVAADVVAADVMGADVVAATDLW